ALALSWTSFPTSKSPPDGSTLNRRSGLPDGRRRAGLPPAPRPLSPLLPLRSAEAGDVVLRYRVTAAAVRRRRRSLAARVVGFRVGEPLGAEPGWRIRPRILT